MTVQLQPTERFSDRVEWYRRHRPRYPAAIVDLLELECGLSRETQIADIAAGTGLLAEIFLARGNPVIAVEPNAPMRAACGSLSSLYPRLHCVDGTAEATNLPDHSVDFVTVGQAMHWFDSRRARTEFKRILRPGGWCVAIYNHRNRSGDAFHAGYERILNEFGIDYTQVQSEHFGDERLVEFFGSSNMRQHTLPNSQTLDLESLKGRILSSSYMPTANHPRYSDMLREIESLFATRQRDGSVHLDYDCVVSYGHLE